MAIYQYAIGATWVGTQLPVSGHLAVDREQALRIVNELIRDGAVNISITKLPTKEVK